MTPGPGNGHLRGYLQPGWT